jgi:hypothetical protein
MKCGVSNDEIKTMKTETASPAALQTASTPTSPNSTSTTTTLVDIVLPAPEVGTAVATADALLEPEA